jgi:valyl-tRNA synthetase
MMEKQPDVRPFNEDLIARFAFAEEVIMAVRNVRKEKNIPQKEAIRLYIRKNNSEQADTTFDEVAARLCNISEISYVEEKVEGAISFIVGTTEFYIPISAAINVEEELAKLQEELTYTEGFLEKVMQKLNNERFVSSAPAAVVNVERKKQEDAQARIQVLKAQIEGLR